VSEPIIEVENLSKHYRLGSFGARSLREETQHLLARITGRKFLRGIYGQTEEEATASFWALKDISFSINAGDVVGIIGRNGAGKSTLLKILSRITEPTHGQATLGGRVGSLLEVGTGFHNELTGRENIYLNGAIHGMKRSEIRRKFDEIVEFAEVGRFIDTPVKRYSSGMYVRLAFAVAAHLEPEILVVDEVLAVGDVSFQKKCLGKMEDVAAKEGRTVLFVSHNMGAIGGLTSKALYLDRGKLSYFGNTPDALAKYFAETFVTDATWTAPAKSRHPVQITELRLRTDSGNALTDFEAAEGFIIELDYEVRQFIRGANIDVLIYAGDGTHIATIGEQDKNPDLLLGRQPGRYTCRVKIPSLLNIGSYFTRISSGVHKQTFDQADTLRFNIVELTTSLRRDRRGLILPMLPWQTIRTGDFEAADESVLEKTQA
jgi:lipopolysaccharide transport system ATP-binding protein